MAGQSLLVSLLGGIALLLWSTRLVRTGIERAFGERLRQLIARATSNRATACASGVVVATALQSSSAAAMLVASFAERKLILLAPALAVMLGADIGSTMVVQALAFDLKAFVPAMLVVGVGLFTWSKPAMWRNLGRALVGVALMILSLGMIISASQPLQSDWLLTLVLQRLEGQPILALAVAALVTWAIHSSVAMILLVMALTAAGSISPLLALTLVLGANVGSGLIAFGMNMAAGLATRRVVLGNLLFRLIGALAAILALPLLMPVVGYLGEGGRLVANAHTLFNLALALVFLPLTGVAAQLLERLLSEPMPQPGERRIEHLDEGSLKTPAVALSGAAREVLRTAEIVEVMLREVILAFEPQGQDRVAAIKTLDDQVDQAQEQVKLYLTRLTRGPLSDADSRRAFDLILFSTNLEHVGDIIDKNLLELAAKRKRLGATFSAEGWRELQDMHARAVEHSRLAVTVFVTRDLDMARQLVRAKDDVRSVERAATESHLRRLREGAVASMETSSLHLDILRDLKRIIAHLTDVAYPILEASGELKGSRLAPGPAEPARASS
jgi:phosphate:Na+ symporter